MFVLALTFAIPFGPAFDLSSTLISEMTQTWLSSLDYSPAATWRALYSLYTTRSTYWSWRHEDETSTWAPNRDNNSLTLGVVDWTAIHNIVSLQFVVIFFPMLGIFLSLHCNKYCTKFVRSVKWTIIRAVISRASFWGNADGQHWRTVALIALNPRSRFMFCC